MWLLHSRTLELKNFVDPTRVKYAILSHVWEDADHTLTFRDVQDIHARCVRSGEDPRSLVTEKVRQFALLASENGYTWIWLDTCCIDKSSSAELSEAINSMYVWYKEAVICYAYLGDVDDHDDPRAPNSQFRRSRWHTRGWTLQELIAPQCVVFLSRQWHTIGSKVSLVQIITEVTGIDVLVLTQESHGPNILVYCVAQRMSWAAKRETTRVEDRAYSLLGIFGISMPIIYGEGLRSFLRLQMEILNIYPGDQSIFAWGEIHDDFNVAHAGIQWPDKRGLAHYGWERLGRVKDLQAIRQQAHQSQIWNGLLAPSPSVFANSADIELLNPTSYKRWYGEDISTKCTFIGHQIILRLPVSTDYIRHSDRPPIRAVVLACGTSRYYRAAIERSRSLASDGTIIVLFLNQDLRPPQPRPGTMSGSVGTAVVNAAGSKFYRGAVLRVHQHDPLVDFKMQKVDICNALSLRILELLHSKDRLLPPDKLKDIFARPYSFFTPMWNVISLRELHGIELTEVAGGPYGGYGAQLVLRSHTRWLGEHPEGEAFDRVGRLQLAIPQGSHVDVLWIDFCVGCPCLQDYHPKDDTGRRLIYPWIWWLSVEWSNSEDGTQKSYIWQRLGQNSVLVGQGLGDGYRDTDCPRAHIHMKRPNLITGKLSEPTSMISPEGDKIIRLQFSTFYDVHRRFIEREPSQIMMLVDLEGFTTRSSSDDLPLPTLRPTLKPSPDASDVVVSSTRPPDDPPSIPAQLSRPEEGWSWTPTVAFRHLRDSQGFRTLVTWLGSDVDYSYGSLV